MAQFPKIQLTRQGKNLVIAGQNKQKILFTKVELGDGVLNGQSIESMTALVHRVMALPLQDFLNKGDGGARLRFVLDNNNLSAVFLIVKLVFSLKWKEEMSSFMLIQMQEI